MKEEHLKQKLNFEQVRNCSVLESFDQAFRKVLQGHSCWIKFSFDMSCLCPSSTSEMSWEVLARLEQEKSSWPLLSQDRQVMLLS